MFHVTPCYNQEYGCSVGARHAACFTLHSPHKCTRRTPAINEAVVYFHDIQNQLANNRMHQHITTLIS
jgi:hypothetical protein